MKSEVRKLWIEGNAGRLQAKLRVAAKPVAAVVVAHPHPLHGGTLHNPVIFHTERELHRRGCTTLRFNFRGVGSSDGEHDEGRGETDDVAAAVAWLRGLSFGEPLVLVGYSFGSWCGIRHAVGDRSIDAVIAIGLPIRKYPFDEIAQLDRPFAVVQGSEDEFGTPKEVQQALDDMNVVAPVHTVDGAPHLFPGRAPDAAAAVVNAFTELLPATPNPT